MKKSLKKMTAYLVLFFACQLSVAEEVSQKVDDPLQDFNRTMFSFNDTLDQYLLLPVTKGYRAIAPEPVEKGVHNFFNNLDDVVVFFNSLFQLKFHDAVHTAARVTANTFFGIAGLIDVGTPLGLEKKNEDFGQTLGYWGVESGPYLVLPFFGSSNVRDGIGLIPDYYMDPVSTVDDDSARLSLQVIRVVDIRSGLMEAEKLISGDRYTFIRDAYMQRREHLVNDGVVSDKFVEDGF